ncbi:DUF615 domain-containing protein [Lysobacter yananisis]|uniref:DUF615 domain-containing protein n=1 Tax=Lysobacter yananisis TaxID=1003114 RepID=A0ABY9P3C6_9GAMM|nr:DUF615 domain-containing protein [Lysobacter yananisis]WMT01429.1 DUF615 domain-containing protein [Lysobacter yananisis]
MTIDPRLLRIETWRTRLIDEGFDGIEAFAAAYPHADRKRLKRLIQEAASMRHRHRMPRKLLRYIRGLDEAADAQPQR